MDRIQLSDDELTLLICNICLQTGHATTANITKDGRIMVTDLETGKTHELHVGIDQTNVASLHEAKSQPRILWMIFIAAVALATMAVLIIAA